MLQAADTLPVNVGLTGKGNDSSPLALREMIEAGACGMKVHEDWGATPAAIDNCLTVCDSHDVQVLIHTDTLNESGFVESTIAAIDGRTIHTYHTEGAGGGHAPDIIKVCELPNVLPASTNPTRPFTLNTLDEHLDMMMMCHHLSKNIPEDVAFAESRIRAETIGAEDVLHDMGAISMMSSDSQAMGRVGEVIAATWNTAHKNKEQRGALPEDEGTGADNFRVKRYVSKYTINPAISQGFAHMVGSIEVGKLADLVVWDPAWFGTKPDFVLKGGFISQAMMVRCSPPSLSPSFITANQHPGRRQRLRRGSPAHHLAPHVRAARARHERPLRQPPLDRLAHHRVVQAQEEGVGRAELPQHHKGGHEVQRPDAQDDGGPGELRRHGGREDMHGGARRRPAARAGAIRVLGGLGAWCTCNGGGLGASISVCGLLYLVSSLDMVVGCWCRLLDIVFTCHGW